MKELKVLKEMRELIKYIYFLTNKFPKNEMYGIISQSRRSAVSVSLNIKEGNNFYDNNKKRFFMIARGSLYELEECIIISSMLNYITDEDKTHFYIIYYKCLNMLKKLISSIQ